MSIQITDLIFKPLFFDLATRKINHYLISIRNHATDRKILEFN